jgi:HEAT repeat protein
MNRFAWILLWVGVTLAGCSDREQELVRLLREGTPDERARAARTLADCDRAVLARAVVPLREALQDPAARIHAASALGDLGAAARPALPDLLRVVQDSDGAVAAVAAWATVRIDPTDRRVRATLERLEGSSNPLLRKVAEAGLARAGG